jgi:N-acetyl-anhydromuramyl-L-alanine amidase AmpD
MKPYLIILSSILFLSSITNDTLIIEDKSIPVTEQRIKNIKEYTRIRYGKAQVQIDPKIIVIHSTESRYHSNSVDNIREYFFDDSLRGRYYKSWNYIRRYGRLNVGTQFIIDRDGTVYRLMPDLLIGRHCIGLDWCSIGIENIGYNDLTQEQMIANVQLCEYLISKYPTIKYVIGHYEYRKFEKTDLWKEKSDMRTIKKDPGIFFMVQIKNQLKLRDVILEEI